jgi:hypothetical protein
LIKNGHIFGISKDTYAHIALQALLLMLELLGTAGTIGTARRYLCSYGTAGIAIIAGTAVIQSQ